MHLNRMIILKLIINIFLRIIIKINPIILHKNADDNIKNSNIKYTLNNIIFDLNQDLSTNHLVTI